MSHLELQTTSQYIYQYVEHKLWGISLIIKNICKAVGRGEEKKA